MLQKEFLEYFRKKKITQGETIEVYKHPRNSDKYILIIENQENAMFVILREKEIDNLCRTLKKYLRNK